MKKRKLTQTTVNESSNKERKKKKLEKSEDQQNFEQVTAISPDCNAPNDPCNTVTMTGRFLEEDNVIEFSATNEEDEFPSEEDNSETQSEEESDEESEEGEIVEEISQNNNVMVNVMPSTSGEGNVPLRESFEMMQDFLIHKGVLLESMKTCKNFWKV